MTSPPSIGQSFQIVTHDLGCKGRHRAPESVMCYAYSTTAHIGFALLLKSQMGGFKNLSLT